MDDDSPTGTPMAASRLTRKERDQLNQDYVHGRDHTDRMKTECCLGSDYDAKEDLLTELTVKCPTYNETKRLSPLCKVPTPDVADGITTMFDDHMFIKPRSVDSVRFGDLVGYFF